MGCAQSRIENEESVARCRERKNFMKEAVCARNAFASGHSGYAVALKNIGAALSDYGQGEVESSQSQQQQQFQVGGGPGDHSSQPPRLPPSPSVLDSTLPPPPPPLPSFSPVPPLQRAMTMPEFPVSAKPSRDMKRVAIDEDDEEGGLDIDEESDLKLRHRRIGARDVGPPTPLTPQSPPRTPAPPPPPPDSKGMAWDYFFMVENTPGPSLSEVDDINEQNDENVGGRFGEKYNVMNNVGGSVGGVEPKTPENVVVEGVVMEEEETPVAVNQEKQFMHSNTAPPDIVRRVNANKIASSVNLLKILSDIDDHFLKASESAQEVTKMLEATRLHYHSNFADNRGTDSCIIVDSGG